MKWKDYEKEVFNYFQDSYPSCSIKFDQKIKGRYSKVNRQVDILIEGEVADYEIRIVIDCKYFSQNVDVKQVESFIGMLDDLDVNQGVLITRKGFSKASINRAYYGNTKLELDVINFDEILDYQGFVALPYKGNKTVIVGAPFGWVLDNKNTPNGFATLYQRGLSLEEAVKNSEWMYFDFWFKYESKAKSISKLIENQNKGILEIDSSSEFEYFASPKREDNFETRIRVANVPKYPCLEVTGFVDFGEYIFYAVLFTSKELYKKNIRKLKYVISKALPAEIKFDNNLIIEKTITKLKSETDKQKRSELNGQIATWYWEMKDIINACKFYDQAIKEMPDHYSVILESLDFYIKNDFTNKFDDLAISFFHQTPTNPRVCQDLIDIAMENNQGDHLLTVFQKMTTINKDDEVLANINFHIGQMHIFQNNTKHSKKYLNLAKKHFSKVYKKDHYVFESINSILSENGI